MKSELTIIKGQEFKISVKDSIKEDDIFIEQYKQAASMLNTILEKNQEDEDEYEKEYSWQRTEYENNIIAFCGERGDGKSSAMLTFINAIYNRDKDKKDDKGIDIFKEYENIRKSYISKPIVIDPSQFDNVHNILDIILAKMYQRFYEKYKKDTRENDEKRTQELLNSFQKVYRQVAMINNQEKMLDDEFDYEGNIGKLSKLGESTNLKTDFKKLIGQYLAFMRNGNENPGNQLLVAIDDLDLCNTAAYKMAEQIRKYLILPNVVIVMAVKIDQLELAMREQNIKEYKELYKIEHSKNGLNNEIQDMAERYVSKLIPKARRIYMPKVQDLGEIKINYQENGKLLEIDKKTLVQAVLKLIYDKTGMLFKAEETGESYLVPNNLRDIVNWIVQLGEMEDPQKFGELQEENINNIYKKNIEKFYQIFKWDWMNRELNAEWKKELELLENMDVIHTNVNAKKMIISLLAEEAGISPKNYEGPRKTRFGERRVEFFEIINYMETFYKNILDQDMEKGLYGLKTLYTFILNRKLLDGELFKSGGYINGYIWGATFSKIIPFVKDEAVDRSRFVLPTWIEYNTILEFHYNSGIRMNENIEKVPQIVNDNSKEKYIKTWILMGLLVNTSEIIGRMPEVIRMTKALIKVIAGNSKLVGNIENSLENYLVALGDVDCIYEKINFEKLGIKEGDKDYSRIIKSIKECNAKSIACARKIAANPDIATRIKEYCKENNDYKGGTESKQNRSEELVNAFFENIVKFMEELDMGIDISAEDLRYFKFDEDETPIDICKLYSLLIEVAVKYKNKGINQNTSFDKGNKLVEMFLEKLTVESTEYSNKWKNVPSYLNNKTAENVKDKLDNLADNIRMYRGILKRWPENMNVKEMCDYYTQIVQLYLGDEKTIISEELHNKYKEIVSIQKKMKEDLKTK